MQSVAGIVALSFIFSALLATLVLGHALQWLFLTLGVIDTPLLGDRFTLTSLLGGVIAFAAAFVLWRTPKVNVLAQEVVSELKKVTWPTAVETRAATVVVIITSAVVSLVLGFFDLGFNYLIKTFI